MRTGTSARQIERPCSFDQFLTVLDDPAPAVSDVPRTLRDRVGYREFGDFGTVLLANSPAAEAATIDRPRVTVGLNLGEWLAIAAVGTIMWTAVFAGLAS